MDNRLLGAAVLTAFAISTEARAQDFDSIGSQVDFVRFTAQERAQAPQRTPAPPPPEPLSGDGDVMVLGQSPTSERAKPFTFSISVPFSYTSNALKADSGTIDDTHINPTLGLSWEKPIRDLTLSASLHLSFDEYVDLAANDQSFILGSFGAMLGDPSKKIAPYVGYAPTVAYLDFYDDHVVTLHDLTLGARRVFVLGTDAQAPTSLLVDVAYTRREASLAASEQHRPTFTLRFTGAISPKVSWIFKPQVQGRYFTGGANDGREDYNFKVLAGVDWKPTLLAKSGSKVSFSVVLERNESDVPGKDYSAWDIGPSISFAHKF